MQTYTKINTLYKRYQFEAKNCPNKKWLLMRNKIILNDFSNIEAKYLYNCDWEAYSKIDGTNSKIAFYPSTQEIKIGGKTDNANSMHGQFEMLQELADRIQPILCEMFPKETAKFLQVKNKETNKIQYYLEACGDAMIEPKAGFCGVELEEIPIYIYGEYFGEGIQKCGRKYIKNGNDFVVFDICQQGWWLPKENRDLLCEKLKLKTVPFIGIKTLADIEKMVIKGFTTQYKDAADPTMLEEGIVARPTVPLFDSRGNRIIVKVKYCDYVEYFQAKNQFTLEEFNEFTKWYEEYLL